MRKIDYMENPIDWVVGWIDSNENITVQLSKYGTDEYLFHPNDSQYVGKRFRWSVHGQDFHSTMDNYYNHLSLDRALTLREHFVIMEWLIKNKYTDEENHNYWRICKKLKEEEDKENE